MAKNNTSIEVLNSNLAFVQFGEEKRPELKKDWQHDYIKYGKKNDFPQELIRYFEEHAEHGAIVNAKARYLWGRGLKAVNEEQNEIADQFLSKANRFESWYKMGQKMALDCELFNAFYLQVITDINGKPVEYYHLQYANCRLSECKTKLYFSEDWTKHSPEFKIFTIYKKGSVGTFFTAFRYYQPAKSRLDAVYTKVPYNGCLSEIKSDIDITTFNESFIRRGFSSSMMVTFFNGEQPPEVKRAIKERFEQTYTGVENAGSVVLNFADKNGQAAAIQPISIDELDKKFEFTSKRLQQKILVSHNVTNPEIFGVKTEGSALGNRVSVKESYELFLNTYSKPRQEPLLSFISDACYLMTGVYIEFDFDQLEPIGYDFSADQDLTQDERRAIKGFEPLNEVSETEKIQASVNSTLTNLTGRQFQGLMRIVNKYDKGTINKQSAIALMVNGFGLSNEDALTFLNENDAIDETIVKMSKQNEDAILARFMELATPDNEAHEVLFEEEVHIHSLKDALKYELKAHKMYFEDALSISVTELDSAVLSAIKGNPTLTQEELARLLKVDISKIKQSIFRLKEKGLIEKNAKAYDITDKGIEKKSEPIKTTEIKTVYKYAVRTPTPPLKGKSRKYCSDLMTMSKDNHWTYEQLEKMENEFGFSTFDYRGGWWTNGNTGETTPYCRHIWKAKTIRIDK